ncbi:MAG: homoserine kinase [Saprospiraceae bacterium]
MQYTVLNIEAINNLARQYDLGEIISFKILSGGSENTNYLIASNIEKYVLTICEQKSTTEAINLSMLLEHLATNNFSTSKIIRNKKNELISTYNDKPVILKSFLEGKTMDNLPNHLIELIGIQMGKLHKINEPDYLPKKLNYGIEQFSDVAIYAENSSFHNWLKKIEDQIKSYFSQPIPQALIHSDIFYSNVIIDDDENNITIMDFEEATYYYRIFDIGMTIVGICCEGELVNLEKVSSLLKGYVQEIELTDLEKNALQVFTIYAAASMSFWRHRNFNYTNPTPGMENHYLALKNIADCVKELPEDCFKKILRLY